MLLTSRTALHAIIPQGKSLTKDGTSHPSGTLGANLELVILQSWLDENYSNSYEYEHKCHTFAVNYIARASFAARSFAS